MSFIDPPTAADYAWAAAEDAKKAAARNEARIAKLETSVRRDEHNRAIRAAQRLLRARAKAMPQKELGYNQWGEDPRAVGYRQAAAELEALIEPEET